MSDAIANLEQRLDTLSRQLGLTKAETSGNPVYTVGPFGRGTAWLKIERRKGHLTFYIRALNIQGETELAGRVRDAVARLAGRATGVGGYYATIGFEDALANWDELVANAIRPFFAESGASPGPARRARVRTEPNEPRTWELSPGTTILRTDLHSLYGGNRQRGISPSSETPNVLVFSDPASGARHGYMDFWDGSIFHYYGEGQRGDQQMTEGNAAILEHDAQGRALRVFDGAGGEVKYLGLFELDQDEPFYRTDAPQTGGGSLRKAIVFRLRPAAGVAGTLAPAALTLSTPYRRAAVTPIAGDIETPEIDPDVIDRGRQAHVSLQNQLADFVADLGGEILSPGPLDPSFDVAWRLRGRLCVAEVKSMTAANETLRLRLGLGQVLHYSHLLKRQGDEATPILFVERQPTDARWVELCADHGVTLLWPEILPSFTG